MKRRAIDWSACAAGLGELLPREKLHPAVLAWARERPANERWGVAFSGGADSLALLLLLWTHWPERRARLVALHFDHRLRGAESRADAAFCRRVCAALGVTLMAGRWTEAKKTAGEAAARTARFAFFQSALRGRRSGVLWLGHQQDDIAETMLMRIARGSGTAGLAAPRPLQDHPGGRVHVRPLLSVKKAELVASLRQVGASWREDSSNLGDDFFRNRVRNSVLPAWSAAAGRDALAGAALARELLAEDDAALESWTDRLGAIAADGTVDLARLRDVPRALTRRVLHRWLGGQRGLGELSRQGFERLLLAVEAGADTKQSAGVRTFFVIRRGHLAVQKSRHRAD